MYVLKYGVIWSKPEAVVVMRRLRQPPKAESRARIQTAQKAPQAGAFWAGSQIAQKFGTLEFASKILNSPDIIEIDQEIWSDPPSKYRYILCLLFCVQYIMRTALYLHASPFRERIRGLPVEMVFLALSLS